MNWKSDLRLYDLEPQTQLEVTCKKCGVTRYETQAVLMKRPGFRHFHIDEVERALKCEARFCKGSVRVSLVHDNTEGFVGGMA